MHRLPEQRNLIGRNRPFLSLRAGGHSVNEFNLRFASLPVAVRIPHDRAVMATTPGRTPFNPYTCNMRRIIKTRGTSRMMKPRPY